MLKRFVVFKNVFIARANELLSEAVALYAEICPSCSSSTVMFLG